jgi:hypothetical protein
LRVEEFDLALGFADHLGGHSAKTAAARSAAAGACAAARTARGTEAAAAASRSAISATATAAEAIPVTICRRRRKCVEIILAKSIAFVPAPAAPTPVKTHAELFTFNIVLDHVLKNKADVNPVAQLLVLFVRTLSAWSNPRKRTRNLRYLNLLSIHRRPFDNQPGINRAKTCGRLKILLCAQQNKHGNRGLPGDSLKPNPTAWRTINGPCARPGLANMPV